MEITRRDTRSLDNGSHDAQAETVERSGRSGIIGLLLRGLNSATIMGIYSN